MKKIIKLFVATAELYQSPLVSKLSNTCDAALTIGEEQLLAVAIPEHQPNTHIEVSYNPVMLELSHIKIEHNRYTEGCLLFIRTRGRELGHTFLTIFTTPQSAAGGLAPRTHFGITRPVPAN